MIRPLSLIVAAIGAGTLLGSPRHKAHVAAEPTHSVWDSVYTDSQAARGDSLYKTTCGKCHGPAATGSDDGPPLVGAVFNSNWNGQTLSDLHDRFRNTMPPDNPKTIPRSQITDIVAYVLAQNHFPSGKLALIDDVTTLKDIKFLQSKP
jgi:Cytochrome c, mono- and diheme variants